MPKSLDLAKGQALLARAIGSMKADGKLSAEEIELRVWLRHNAKDLLSFQEKFRAALTKK